jgi:azurin
MHTTTLHSPSHQLLRVLIVIALALGLVVLLAACGTDAPQPQPTAQAPAPTEAPAATPTAAPEGVRTITIRPVGNEMRFEQTEITATAGETIRVVYDNTPATSPAMMHNVVFVRSHADINRVGQAAMGASDRQYVPEDPAVIAATPLAGPGDVVEVTFTVPDEPGDYAYACTFPGHYMMMQGTLRVTARPSV